MTEPTHTKELKSTGYELFILLLSLLSICNLVFGVSAGLLARDQDSLDVVAFIDTVLTVFFLFDFVYRLLTVPSRAAYFVRNWGWADLLACVPGLRVFRVFRIFRAVRLLRQFGARNMVNEVVNNRAGSALYLTVFSIMLLAEMGGVLVLKAEAASPNANLTSAPDAVWWVFVTLTTVGYGDRYPVTSGGRAVGILIMLSGVALIGVLASYLSNWFLSSPKKPAAEAPAGPDDLNARLARLEALLEEQTRASAAIREELAAIRKRLP